MRGLIHTYSTGMGELLASKVLCRIQGYDIMVGGNARAPAQQRPRAAALCGKARCYGLL